MFSQDDMQELLTYEGNGDGVISVYLDTDSARQSTEAIKLMARGLLKEVQPQHEKEAQTIERYLDLGYDWSKPGLALFCGQGGEFFRSYPSPVAFRNRIRLGPRPYVKPLAHFLDHYAHFGVIVVDRVSGRFYAYHLGEPQATEEFTGEEVRKVKRGGGSSAVGRRGGGGTSGPGGGDHEEEVAARNLRDCAAAAGRFYATRPIRRLFLGGTNETLAQFREMLPKQLQSCLAGSFAVDKDMGETEVRRRALELLRQANAEREAELVERLINLQAMGANAVVGLDDVLQAVSDKRVEALIISDGFRYHGYIDEASGFVVSNLARSPLAENELAEVEDVVDTAVAATVAQGGHVEIIADNLALEDAGRIGAILRY
ncbi:MAG: host attachment protein [Candidatus Promineofilum sp.]|nr:host attachment protein [Promineifilum sp.]